MKCRGRAEKIKRNKNEKREQAEIKETPEKEMNKMRTLNGNTSRMAVQ